MAGQNYHKVLADHKRRLGDYEQVHFRRSAIYESTASSKPSTSRFSVAVPAAGSGSSTGKGIKLAPRRTSKALTQVTEFNPSTASLHLRQTEGLWLVPDISRQEATKALFDRPVGTFIVRNSQKARYALSVRVPIDDPAVSHFLIQTNQQGFLTIQGSNLPFLSIYDLLAYFCFNKSGGMPCFLIKPQTSEESRDPESSDSSDSDDDSKGFQSQSYSPRSTPPPPLVPPHQGPRAYQRVPLYEVDEDVFLDPHEQSNHDQMSGSRSPPPLSPTTQSSHPKQSGKRQPPPKPPRGATLFEHGFSPAEAKVLRSVNSIVDMDPRKLCHSYRKISLVKGPLEFDEELEDDVENKNSPPTLLQRRHDLQRRMSWGSDNESGRRHVNSLVELFEKDGQSAVKRGLPPPPRLRHKVAEQGDSIPQLPPRPSRPPCPPRPSGNSNEPPAVPPHTPAPLVPPRPAGSKAPFVPSRDRSISDTTYPVKPRPPAPPPAPPPVETHFPPIPPRTWKGLRVVGNYEFDLELKERVTSNKRKGDEEEDQDVRDWTSASCEPRLVGQVNGITASTAGVQNADSEKEGSVKDRSKWKRAWPKKLPKFYRKPRKKIKKFIIDLSTDNSQEFGRMIGDFISDVKSRSADPYQKMLSEIRTFTTKMHDYLLQNHHADLINCGMESCTNFEHVIETSLQHSILKPLSLYVYLRIEEHLMENSALFQVQRSVHQGKYKTPQEMGIRECLVVPGDKVISEIEGIFDRMTKTYCAISKLEFLLEAVRLTYENVRDSKNPKKTMNDLGADDFLPLFVWVLVQCAFTRAEIEAEYMWGLAHPSLFNGEAGYYLTTLTSAINVLKETQPVVSEFPENIEDKIQYLPCMNNLQTELKIYFEDASTGQYSSAYHLAVVPDMTVAEVCDIIAKKHCKSNPESYGLFTVVNGQATEMLKEARPQEVKKKWALERTTGKPQGQPTSRFLAYRLRTHPLYK